MKLYLNICIYQTVHINPYVYLYTSLGKKTEEFHQRQYNPSGQYSCPNVQLVLSVYNTLGIDASLPANRVRVFEILDSLD